LSLLNAVLQLSTQLSGATVLVGALIEAALFLGLGVPMRAGRLWARMALMSVAWVFIAIGVLAGFALNSAFGHEVDGLVAFALICVAGKLLLIIVGTVLMYRPENRGYFR
jgi:hypothetical protein